LEKKLRVGVIYGGRSGEHEVSIRSAASVIQAIDHSRYDVLPIGITKEGKWLSPPDAVALLPTESRALLPKKLSVRISSDVAIFGDPSHRGLVSVNSSGQSQASDPLDVVFPLLHGPYGEDGTIQGLLEMANVPYVGCGVLASSCGMDKVAMKSLFKEAGLPVCKYIWCLRSEWTEDPASVLRKVKRELGFPCFVKPANLGSSVGVSKAVDNESLARAIDLAARYDRKIIIEEGLTAREIECAIIGNDNPEASLPGEYVIHNESARFLDYEEKYTNTGHAEFVVPAALSKAVTEKIQRLAIRAFKAIDGAGLARVDFFLRDDTKELIVNELNTMPGLTEVSGYPKMWEASGMKFSQVLERMIELAFEKHRDKLLNQTSR
jgi:D-alanine-D-alanine ligase